MKKLTIILTIMIITVCAVFAASGDELKLAASVPVTKPEFKMYGGISAYTEAEGGAPGTDHASLTADNTITSNDDISEKDITVKVQVKQSVRSKYQNAAGFDLTIEASELQHTELTGTGTATGVPAATNKTAAVTTGNLQVSGTATANKVVYKLKYPTKANISADTLIAEMEFKWTKNADLPYGNYVAYISMTYTAN